MRVLAISDLHGYLPRIEVEADVLLIAGDIGPDMYTGEQWNGKQAQKRWYKEFFGPWLDTIPVKDIIVVAGNHDNLIANNPGMMKDFPITYLQDETVNIDGFNIHGTPWSVTFGGFPFMMSENQLVERWQKIPLDTDILIVHGPPYGFQDRVVAWQGEYDESGEIIQKGYSVGSQTLRNKIMDLQDLKLCVFGHIHEAYGREDYFGKIFANVSHMKHGFTPGNNPMFFEVTK